MSMNPLSITRTNQLLDHYWNSCILCCITLRHTGHWSTFCEHLKQNRCPQVSTVSRGFSQQISQVSLEGVSTKRSTMIKLILSLLMNYLIQSLIQLRFYIRHIFSSVYCILQREEEISHTYTEER